MKTVTARLHIEVFVNCPKCGITIDLLNENDTNGDDLDDDNQIMKQACPTNGNCWIDEHKNFEVEEVTCTQCKTKFNVNGLEW